MDTVGNAILGLLFLVVSAAATILMFYLWGFPFDHEKLKSEAPRSLMVVHRLLGYVYLGLYLYFMVQMVPRMWSYQIELPARTVVHLVVGISIGAILVVKLIIVRFFKHLESTLVPFWGTALFVCTVVLMGLALPTTLREYYLLQEAQSGDMFNKDRIERVRTLLPMAGFDDDQLLDVLASPEGLLSGRTVLTSKCVQCHDLRTVLARPRTPDAWRQTVQRMSNRSTVLNPITEEEQWQVTAYLIAISPTLQRTERLRREQEVLTAEANQQAQEAGEMVDDEAMDEEMPYDSVAARNLFETRCSQCHGIDQVANNPPGSDEEASALVMRMVRNGLISPEEELVQIIRYLRETYVRPGPRPQAVSETSPPAEQTRLAEQDNAQVFIIRPIGNELKFETTEIVAQAGSQIRVVMENTATMQGMLHNVTFIRSREEVEAVVTAALQAGDRGYIPDHEAVIASTGTATPGTSQEVVFTVPDPGTYPYICSVPGHSFTMQGTLRSVQ